MGSFSCKNRERKRFNYDFENIVYNQNAGHMMQLLWKTTNKVGVGVVTTRDKTWIVARYKPPGNSQTTNIKNFIGKPLKGLYRVSTFNPCALFVLCALFHFFPLQSYSTIKS